MPCYRPLRAFQCADGAVVFSELKKHDVTRTLDLPCGQCVGCRLDRSNAWAHRCWHEAQLHQDNAFITLTYDEQHLPENNQLVYRDWQLFMKKLRAKTSMDIELESKTEPRKCTPPCTTRTTKSRDINIPENLNTENLRKKQKKKTKKIKFYMAGEYGTEKGRPHFHACLFGHDFKDKIYYKKTSSGSKLYTSETLDKIWGKGFTSIGDVTIESAAYIARYIVAKITGPGSERYYERINYNTGEIYDLTPEFNRMSLKPGIASEWIEKYESDCYPEGELTLLEGRKTRTPKYYDRKYKKREPLKYEQMLWQREQRAKEYLSDNTPQRLKVREQVAQDRINRMIRLLP
ncbi:MAG: replication initiator protein [Microvirus sp.]|nr:MAG: replication initiator protein [Microvirus sp.]